MIVNNDIEENEESNNEYSENPLKCRCGGESSALRKVDNCRDRWTIHCEVKRCQARVSGQGKKSTVLGWNRLSLHLFR
jgi:hypothetical protein